MRAAVVVPSAEGGSVEVRDVSAPAVTPGRILVRVKAAGINRGEILMRRASTKGAPVIVGVEFAGEVTGIGDGVRGFKAGDRVMGHGRATQAEYVLSDPRALMRVPAHLNWAEAAAFPNVFTTAHDAVVTNGTLRAGESVLVNAAASGIGTAAIQIARAFGAKVIVGTSRDRGKLDKVMALGLTHGVVTPGESLAETVRAATAGRGVDLVIDSVGGPALGDTLKAMAVQGRLIQIGRLGGRTGEIDMDRLSFNRLRLIGASFRTRSTEETLACVEACARDLLPLLAGQNLTVPVDRRFPLDKIAEAHDYVEKDEHVGKVVLTLD